MNYQELFYAWTILEAYGAGELRRYYLGLSSSTGSQHIMVACLSEAELFRTKEGAMCDSDLPESASEWKLVPVTMSYPL